MLTVPEQVLPLPEEVLIVLEQVLVFLEEVLVVLEEVLAILTRLEPVFIRWRCLKGDKIPATKTLTCLTTVRTTRKSKHG